jgi:hypothetical protein
MEDGKMPLQPASNPFSYRDNKGVKRYIWQPGDPDGVRDSEFPDGTVFKERWRFLQSDVGPIERGCNSPPHYVVLDDKAAYDIITSKAYTNKERGQFWPFDFLGTGQIRTIRANRGRAAIVSGEEGDLIDTKDGQGVRNIAWTMIGDSKKRRKYWFLGERAGFNQVVFEGPAGRANVEEKCTGKRKAGAPLSPRHKRPRVGRYLHATPSPPWPGSSRGKAAIRAPSEGSVDEQDCHDKSEWSRARGTDGRTIYARAETRCQGQDDENNAQPVWKMVKKMSDELAYTRGLLRMRDEKIQRLEGELKLAKEELKVLEDGWEGLEGQE